MRKMKAESVSLNSILSICVCVCVCARKMVFALSVLEVVTSEFYQFNYYDEV